MFHRVKSEEDSSQDASAPAEMKKAEPQQNAPRETAPEKPEARNTKAEETGNLELETPTETPTRQTEDKSTMSEQEKSPQREEMAPAAMSPYQRPGQAPVRSAGYPGAYPGMATASAADASDSDRRLTIGRGITMSGEIESCDYLLVEGTVEAALKGANILEIAESGVFYGTVEINEANISGRFEGDITVNGRLTISSSGTVTGSISYKEIEIEAGAVLDGKLTPLGGSGASEKKLSAARAAKPALAPKASEKPADKQQEAANTDGELFSKTAAAAE